MSIDPITTVVDAGKTILNKFVADKMPEADRIKLQNEFELEARRQAADESTEFHRFVTDYAGSAADYKDIPFLGPFMLLIRGLVRPATTYATMYFNWRYFTQTGFPENAVSLLMAMNIIVLSFWFGDRIISNPAVANLLSIFVGRKTNG